MKKIILVLITICVIITAVICFIYNKVSTNINSSVHIVEMYGEGYSSGQDDALKELSYGTTKCQGYQNLQAIYKLAFDAGYGYGYADQLEGIKQHEDYGSNYEPWRFTGFEYRIYSLFAK